MKLFIENYKPQTILMIWGRLEKFRNLGILYFLSFFEENTE